MSHLWNSPNQTAGRPKDIAARLKLAEIIAVVAGEYGVEKLLEIGDALLAAPILAVEIALTGPEALEAISDLRHRAQSHMLIGAGNVDSPAQLEAAVAAEAQFTVANDFDPPLLEQATARQVLHIPTVGTFNTARQALTRGCLLIKTNHLSPADLKRLQPDNREPLFLPAAGVSLANLAAYVEAGAAAVAVNDLVVGPAPAQAAIITRSRCWSVAWKGIERQSLS